MKRWDHPTLDTVCRVIVSYNALEDGMPDSSELEAVRALQHQLLELLGDAVVYPAHRTGAGHQLTFLYLDSASDTKARIQSWSEAHDRPIAIECEPDPGWKLRPR